MPIQFRCQKCSQWLEVDEPHAGGKAICPYCQAINDVPKQPAENNQARAPANPDEPAQEGEKSPYTGVSAEHTRPTAPDVPARKPLEEEERSSRAPAPGEYDEGWFDAGRSGLPTPPGAGRLGKIGLVLTLIAWGMVLAVNIATFVLVPVDLLKKLQTPSGLQTLLEHPWLIAIIVASLLAFLADIVGLSMSLATLFGSRPGGKGYALAGAIAGGMLLLFACAGMLMGSGAGG